MELRTSPIPVEFNSSQVYVFESHHAPAFHMEMGVWDFDKLCLIRQGNGLIEIANSEINTNRIPLREGHIIHVPAYAPHRFTDQPDAPLSLMMVCFYQDTVGSNSITNSAYRDFSSEIDSLSPFDLRQTHRHSTILEGFRRMIFEQTRKQSGYELILWGTFIQLLVALTRSHHEVYSRRPASQDPAFAQTLEYLEEQFTDPIQIQDLADMAGVSYRRYTTLFKQAKGETVNSYLTRLRIAYAKHRLVESGNVLFSAYESGFGDLSHFYRVFKKETGKTPKQYIKSHL